MARQSWEPLVWCYLATAPRGGEAVDISESLVSTCLCTVYGPYSTNTNTSYSVIFFPTCLWEPVKNKRSHNSERYISQSSGDPAPLQLVQEETRPSLPPCENTTGPFSSWHIHLLQSAHTQTVHTAQQWVCAASVGGKDAQNNNKKKEKKKKKQRFFSPII